MIKLNLLSHILSLVSIGLIFYILSMVISGWWVSNRVVELIQGEAEISVYFHETMNQESSLKLVEAIKSIDGVREAKIIDEDESYNRMVDILGKEAAVLEFFDDNPFSAFIEVKIHIDEIDSILDKLEKIDGIEYIRDNKQVLDRISSISSVFKVLGFLVVAAVGISTLVIISHIIRMGIYSNKDEINTLRLLGAPESFIAVPFLLGGILLTLLGAILSVIMSVFSLRYIYSQMTGPLPFIPLPSKETLIQGLTILVLSFSLILGVVGSLLGISSARNN